MMEYFKIYTNQSPPPGQVTVVALVDIHGLQRCLAGVVSADQWHCFLGEGVKPPNYI